MGKSLTLSLLTLAVIMSGPATAANIPADAVLSDRQELVRRGTSLPLTLDPLKQSQPQQDPWLQDLFEGLTTENPQGNIVPGVAASRNSNNNRH